MPRTATITRALDLSDRARLLVLEAGGAEPFAFLAGQHASIGFPVGSGKKSGPYSIASAPDGTPRFEILLNLVSHDAESPFDQFRAGVEVEVLGPSGSFLFRDKPDHRAVFVAGGTGIAPLRSMILDALGRGVRREMDLVLAGRSRNHLYFLSEWRDLEHARSNFTCYTVLSEPGAAWAGLRGLPTAHLDLFSSEPERTDFYLCGPPPLVALLRQALPARGADPARIFTES
ncbi:MAG: FAD-dependent oxidoreductase [Nitrospirae bacterium]|nr:FAD-dependent oxidoreductase [Nitrospirota bacterium]